MDRRFRPNVDVFRIAGDEADTDRVLAARDMDPCAEDRPSGQASWRRGDLPKVATTDMCGERPRGSQAGQRSSRSALRRRDGAHATALLRCARAHGGVAWCREVWDRVRHPFDPSAFFAIVFFAAGCSSGNGASVVPVTTANASATVEASATATASSAAPSAPPQDALAVVPMKISIPAKNVVITMELKSDATVWLGARGESVQTGVVEGDHIKSVSPEPGMDPFGVAASAEGEVLVSMGGQKAPMNVRFDAHDALHIDDVTMTIDDKGEVEGQSRGEKPEKMATVAGFKPEARRTALLLILFFRVGRNAYHAGH